MIEHWHLDPAIAHLNHGSFGGVPRVVLARQNELRLQMEQNPQAFMVRDLEPLLAEARHQAAAFVGVNPRDFAFVANATEGVNAVLRSLRFSPGDELLTTDHAYPACRNVLDYVARRDGATVVAVPLTFPAQASEWSSAIRQRVTKRTRLALLDHVTSPSAVVLPIAELAQALESQDVRVLVDGAHAPGMLDLDVESIGASYYVGNFHKWVCAPKGAAFLWVREGRQAGVVPTRVSIGMSARLPGQSEFHALFDWTGTSDFTPFLSVPAAIQFVESLPGGWPGARDQMRARILSVREVLDERGYRCPPASCLGSMVAFEIGTHKNVTEKLLGHGVEVPTKVLPSGQHLLRVSAHLYNRDKDYERLFSALAKEQVAPTGRVASPGR